MKERLIAIMNIRKANRVLMVQAATPLEMRHYNRRVSKIASNTRYSTHTPEEASRKFNIGIERAKETIKVKTKKGIHHALHPLHQFYRVDHMNFNRKRLNGQFYCNHLVAKTRSLDGNTGAWVYTAGSFTAVYPVKIRKGAGNTLRRFADDVGIPDRLRTDLEPELTGKNTEFQAQAKRLGIDVTHSETERSNQNHAAEREIGELKKQFKQKMISKGAPKRVWDYGFVHQAGIMNRISRGRNGRTGIK